MAKSKSEFKIPQGKLTNHTSITESEFAYVLPFFEKVYDDHFKYFTFSGEPRIRLSCKREGRVFRASEDALYFILFYLKSYPTEEVLASTFDMYQPQANVWKQLLQKLLEATFSEMKVLPSRDSKRLNQLIKEMGLTEVIIDAAERQIQRPKDYEVQKEYYSGKKKAIRLKTP